MADDSAGVLFQGRKRHRPYLLRRVIMWLSFIAGFHVLSLLIAATAVQKPELRNVIYLTGQHPIVPTDLPETQYLTHVALAFMRSDVFNDAERDQDEGAGAGASASDWPLFTTVDHVRGQLANTTKVLVAIGGWGDTAGFAAGAHTAAARARFARNVARMVAATGADGVDVDWEYPGGNGDDYRQVPNARKAWEVEAYVLLLAAIRRALGANAVLSAAVPGRPEDVALAWTAATVPRILQHVDFLNVMSYDLLNRRDRATAHHTGVAGSLAAVDAYVAAGAPPSTLNLGLAFYVKYVRTTHADCAARVRARAAAATSAAVLPPVGCRTLLLEDPDTGADLGRLGMFSWHDAVPAAVQASFARARAQEQADNGAYADGDGFAFWDEAEDLWWTYETAAGIAQHKVVGVVQERGLGGVFAWGLGEDGPDYVHFQAMGKAWKRLRDGGEGERDGEHIDRSEL